MKGMANRQKRIVRARENLQKRWLELQKAKQKALGAKRRRKRK